MAEQIQTRRFRGEFVPQESFKVVLNSEGASMGETVEAFKARQSSLPGLCPIESAVSDLAGIEARGAIFTRREVVNFILDLVGYSAEQPLVARRVLEPSFGSGDFLLAIIGRLVDAWKRKRGSKHALQDLGDSIRAVEVHRETFRKTRERLLEELVSLGLGPEESEALMSRWLVPSDFLLADLDGRFDVVVGNPPYVRQELVPDALLAEYRSRFTTIYDRADLYIPFIEKSLTLLNDKGQLGFICADRWMKNRYGGPLRELVAEQFHLKAYVDMVNTAAFHSDVIAYPAIFVIDRNRSRETRVASRPEIDSIHLTALSKALLGTKAAAQKSGVTVLENVASGSEPWILEAAEELALIRRLESTFPNLEEAGCKVGIGVATGADRAFIGDFEELDVETSRKLPLAMTRDILTGIVQWKGKGVVNPFKDDGGLVDLEKFPRLKRYLEARKSEIAGRHVAKKSPANWYRTIDRITPSIAQKPKLLIPDIKGGAHIVFENGRLYPHHNLYYITSDDWDLKALQAVLISGIAHLFVSIYSTKMHGGFLRFQAQYLRRIRLPKWESVPPAVKKQLKLATEHLAMEERNLAVAALYGLDKHEQSLLKSIRANYGD